MYLKVILRFLLNYFQNLEMLIKFILIGKISNIDELISIGDVIEVDLSFFENSNNIVATEMNLDIIYEDNYLLVLNKPAGIPVHPSSLHFKDTLSNGVKYYFNTINLNRKIRIVNRLDRDTSGIVIFAKNQYVQEMLILQMKDNCFKKEYIGILDGILEFPEGIINAPIARKRDSIIERCVDEAGQTSVTHYKLIKTFNNLSLVHFILETGRTHQIRVHTKYIGHPIIGDTLYGIETSIISRQALHSYKIKFIHPITGKNMELISDIPNDITFIYE